VRSPARVLKDVERLLTHIAGELTKVMELEFQARPLWPTDPDDDCAVFLTMIPPLCETTRQGLTLHKLADIGRANG
jgi:hypothetical protein